MQEYYLAVTYDVCEHNELFQDMNEYPIRSFVDMEAEVREFAKRDVAPLVRVYVSDTPNFKNVTLHKDFTFQEYECGCDSHSI